MDIPETSSSSLKGSATLCEYELALRVYDDLAERYEAEAAQLSEAELVTLEANITRSLCQALSSRPLSLRQGPYRPKLDEWLRIIGLSPPNIRHLELCGISDILGIVSKTEKETNTLADRGRYTSDSKRKVLKCCEVTRSYLEFLNHNKGRRESSGFSDKDLAWSVCSPSSSRRSPAVRAVSAESASPPSPRFVVTCTTDSERDSFCSDMQSASGSFPGTPQISSSGNSHSRSASASVSGSGSLSVLSGRNTLSPSSPSSVSAQSTPALGINSRVVHSTSMQFGTSPKSPKTTRFPHTIPHKWYKSTKYWYSTDSVCVYCKRPLGFGFRTSWEKCRSCKFKVHTHCKSRIADSCGLTPDHLKCLLDKVVQQSYGCQWNDPQSASVPSSRSLNEPAFQYPDNAAAIADSSSSTNSSAPSTPALPLGMGANSPYNLATVPTRSCVTKFTFPDVPELPDIILPDTNEATNTTSYKSVRVDLTADGSEGTLVLDSTGSGSTDLVTSTGSSDARSPNHTWDRNRWSMSTIRGPNTTQASWNEVTIPLCKIEFKPHALLGYGRFGYVKRGFHFGDVAVKFLNMDHIQESRRLEEFKSEVAAHKNTRHDNIVLFLGYCMEQDQMAIVMSLCKGQSLHRLLHELKEKLDMKASFNIATQICQGVSYLHTKKILHKDLRSKNVFVESKAKVVISDFGLFSMKRLMTPCRSNTIVVPQHWLAYQAPEIIKAIGGPSDEFPFSDASDVYAFSTLLYELLTASFPWDKEHPDVILWMIGMGLKPPIHSLKASQELKELLLRCWSFSDEDRPTSSDVLNLLNTLRPRVLRIPVRRSHESHF